MCQTSVTNQIAKVPEGNQTSGSEDGDMRCVCGPALRAVGVGEIPSKAPKGYMWKVTG